MGDILISTTKIYFKLIYYRLVSKIIIKVGKDEEDTYITDVVQRCSFCF